MRSFVNFRKTVVLALGFVPLVSKFVFLSPEEIIEKETKLGMVNYIKQMKRTERNNLHFGYGMYLRNRYRMWHPKNPYTIQKLNAVPESHRVNSPFHPDNLSWSIISRLIVASGYSVRTPIDVSENILYSLIVKDDSQDSLDALRDAVTNLVDTGSFDVLETTFEECLQFDPSQEKLKVMLGAIAGHDNKISPITYLEIAKRAVSKSL